MLVVVAHNHIKKIETKLHEQNNMHIIVRINIHSKYYLFLCSMSCGKMHRKF